MTPLCVRVRVRERESRGEGVLHCCFYQNMITFSSSTFEKATLQSMGSSLNCCRLVARDFDGRLAEVVGLWLYFPAISSACPIH